MRKFTVVTLALALAVPGAGQATASTAALQEREVAPDTIAVDDLPLSLSPARAGPLLAVLLTGDGGLAAGDRSIAAALTGHDVAVVALNSPIYLERRPTPDEAANDLARILRHFLDTWHRERAIIVGYSRGADLAPFLVSRLPGDLREHVALTVLLGPGEWAGFHYKPLDLLRAHSGKSEFPVSAEVSKLRGSPVLCIYGSGDRGAICQSLAVSGLVRAIVRAGGHRVGGHEGSALVDTMLAALP